MQPPNVHPENADALEAFQRAGGCTHPTLSGVGPPIWSDIREVLELHGLWAADVQERLGRLMAQVKDVTNRETEQEREERKGGADG